jgi:cyclopropane-fatty-acyl-phospholipid synthase
MRVTDMKLVHMEDITPHYAETLRRWRDGFRNRAGTVREMGFPESFLRLWEYYLCYCEAGFMERYIGDVQMVFAKPLNRADPVLPPLDAGS